MCCSFFDWDQTIHRKAGLSRGYALQTSSLLPLIPLLGVNLDSSLPAVIQNSSDYKAGYDQDEYATKDDSNIH